jgi:NAD-dependent dihydropyrimidine dehydrogenase PreA subunit
MIEVVVEGRCISCDRCIDVCPTQVFDRRADGLPLLARQGDCQTCFLCEAYCPTDALFVAPTTEPLPEGSPLADPEQLETSGLLGSYRAALGWGQGRTPTAHQAVMPELPKS